MCIVRAPSSGWDSLVYGGLPDFVVRAEHTVARSRDACRSSGQGIEERRDVAFYESVYIARPDISAAQVEALTQRLTEIIEAGGGRVTKNEYWGLKNLAYRIKKNRKGHYSLLNIDAPSGAVGEYERNMRLSEDVLRYLTVKVDELDDNPSIMMTRGSRDDRGRGRGRGFGGRDGPRPQSAPPPAAADAAKAESKPADEPKETTE